MRNLNFDQLLDSFVELAPDNQQYTTDVLFRESSPESQSFPSSPDSGFDIDSHLGNNKHFLTRIP